MKTIKEYAADTDLRLAGQVTRVQFYVDAQLHRRFELIAQRENVLTNDVLRYAVEAYLLGDVE